MTKPIDVDVNVHWVIVGPLKKKIPKYFDLLKLANRLEGQVVL